jgi:prefoldin subunit 5
MNVNVDPDALRVAGTALNLVGDQLNSALDQLESEIQSLDQPWGNDEIGQLIGVAFHEVVAYAFECLHDVLDEIRSSGVDLKSMAQRYESQEQQIIAIFEGLRQHTEGR